MSPKTCQALSTHPTCLRSVVPVYLVLLPLPPRLHDRPTVQTLGCGGVVPFDLVRDKRGTATAAPGGQISPSLRQPGSALLCIVEREPHLRNTVAPLDDNPQRWSVER